MAQNYFALRGLDAEAELLAETVKLREQALALVKRRFAAVEISELDVARVRTELAVTRADYVSTLEVIAAERQVLATQRPATQVERERALARWR